MFEGQDSADVIRRLNEIEEGFNRHHQNGVKEIIDAIKTLGDIDQAGIETIVEAIHDEQVVILAAIQASEDAIIAAIQGLVPPDEATSLSLSYSLASEKARLRKQIIQKHGLIQPRQNL